jgi:hypothetical protein
MNCVECGKRFEAKRQDAQFCCREHSVAFHNRRKERGAALYDLFMINRHERETAKALRIWFLITRLAMYWREQDERERAGRKSWLPARKAVEATMWAFATVIKR